MIADALVLQSLAALVLERRVGLALPITACRNLRQSGVTPQNQCGNTCDRSGSPVRADRCFSAHTGGRMRSAPRTVLQAFGGLRDLIGVALSAIENHLPGSLAGRVPRFNEGKPLCQTA